MHTYTDYKVFLSAFAFSKPVFFLCLNCSNQAVINENPLTVIHNLTNIPSTTAPTSSSASAVSIHHWNSTSSFSSTQSSMCSLLPSANWEIFPQVKMLTYFLFHGIEEHMRPLLYVYIAIHPYRPHPPSQQKVRSLSSPNSPSTQLKSCCLLERDDTSIFFRTFQQT